MSEDTKMNYEDFNICQSCDKVLFKSEKVCPNCGATNFISFTEKIEKLGSVRNGLGCLAAIIAILIVISTGPIGIVFALPIVWLGQALEKNGKNARKKRKIRYMNDVTTLLKNRASQQKDDIISKYKEGSKHFSEENFAQAISLFEEGLSLGDSNKILYYKLAISYYNTGQYDKALPIFEELVHTEDFPDAKELLARGIVESGIIGERLTQLKQLKESTDKKKLQDYITLAIADYYYFNQEGASEDIELIETAITLRPTEARYVEIMVNYLGENNVDKVIAYCANLPWECHSKETILAWAKAYGSIREISDLAIKVYMKAIEFNPEDMDLRVALSEALVGQGNYDAALRFTTEGLKVKEDIRLQHILALIYSLTDQIELSIEAYQKLMNMANFESYIDKAVIYRQLSNCFIKKDMLDLALKQLMLADRSKASLDQLYRLGELFVNKGDLKKALVCFEEIYATDVRFKDVSAKIQELQ